MRKLSSAMMDFFRSEKFFYAILCLFAAEAIILACTSRFPMPFDEGYHFELIRFFSSRLSPVVGHQPSDTFALGALQQNPSLLYHYLLSFPYRFLWLFTHNLIAEVVMLRLINVGLALASLVYMKKVLAALRIPKLLANLAIFIFAFTPITMAVSSQISYDNLLIFLVALSMYLSVKIVGRLKQGESDIQTVFALLIVCLFASLVKYAFLPIFLGILIWLGWEHIAIRRKGKHLRPSISKQFRDMTPAAKIFLATALALGSFLFIGCYGVNLVKYHNPVPQCNQILNNSDCRQYYAWDLNDKAWQYHIHHPEHLWNVVVYSGLWVVTQIVFMFGAVIPLVGVVKLSLLLLVPSGLLLVVAAVGAVANYKLVFRGRSNFKGVLAVSFVYVFFLWARNYHDYLHLGEFAAVNSRYLLPITLYVYALLGLGGYYILQNRRYTQAIQKILAAAIILLFCCFGGFIPYLRYVSPNYGWISDSWCSKNDHTASGIYCLREGPPSLGTDRAAARPAFSGE